MERHRPTREEVVEYIAGIIQKEGPLDKERQEEALLSAFDALKVTKEPRRKPEYH